jgi:protein TonB
MTDNPREFIPVLVTALLLACPTGSAIGTESTSAEVLADATAPVPDHTPAPVYPDFARTAMLDGTVVLHVLVGTDGRVKNVKVVKGVLGLDEASVAAVKQWTFLPARQNNEKIAAWTAVPIIFKLSTGNFEGPPSPPSKPRVVPTLPRGYQLEDVTIELWRTGCFGTCPSYRLVIRGTGDCTYFGSDYVSEKGEIPFHVEPSAVIDLLNDLYGMEFFNLKDYYIERETVHALPDGTVAQSRLVVSDIPHQIVAVKIGAYVKRVEKNSMFGPQDLVTFGEKMDAVTQSSQWIKAQPSSR